LRIFEIRDGGSHNFEKLKIALSHNGLTDFDEIWHDDALPTPYPVSQ